jgi:hypothetical protein
MRFDLNQAIPVLERTPAVLRTLLAGLPDGWIVRNEGGDSWSPFNVVGHLIDGERTDWIPRARIILSREARPFEPFDRFNHLAATRGASLAELLDSFAQLRTANLHTLRGWNLTPSLLDLPGMHPELGPVTLKELLATWVVHDLGHIGQIVRVMAKQYDGEVGPWKEYLPVLTR